MDMYDQKQAFFTNAKNPAATYLITAKSAVEAAEVAEAFVQHVFCMEKSACGKCIFCQKFADGNLTDYLQIDGDGIVMEDAHGILDFLANAAYEAAHRIVHISNMQDVPVRIQNFLLKVLEEPPKGVIFLLSTNQKERILPTVRSRCIEIDIEPEQTATIAAQLVAEGYAKNAEVAARWSEGSYAYAKQLSEDEMFTALRNTAKGVLLRLATKRNPSLFLMEQDIFSAGKRVADLLFAMVTLLRDALFYKANVADAYNKDQQETIAVLANSFTSVKLHCIMNTVFNTYEKKQRFPQLRDDLLIRGMLFDILEVKNDECDRRTV